MTQVHTEDLAFSVPESRVEATSYMHRYAFNGTGDIHSYNACCGFVDGVDGAPKANNTAPYNRGYEEGKAYRESK